MGYIRAAGCVVFSAVYFILQIPALGIAYYLGHFSKEKQDKAAMNVLKGYAKGLLKISGSKISVMGEDNIPNDTPVLYVANHKGMFDVFLTYSMITKPTGFIGKKEMGKIPLASRWFRLSNCMFLDRDNPRQGLEVILSAIEKIKNGYSVFVFPEGTRNHKDTLLPFKEGCMKIAKKTGCPVVPVAIAHTDDILERNFPQVCPADIIVKYGKPVLIENLSEEEQKKPGAYFRKLIQEMYDEVNRL